MSNQNQPHSLTLIKKKTKECIDESDFVRPGNIMQYLDQINPYIPINSLIDSIFDSTWQSKKHAITNSKTGD